ncbi:hypothetical protein ABPG75_000315 [Micractinium tetrahymenae]
MAWDRLPQDVLLSIFDRVAEAHRPHEPYEEAPASATLQLVSKAWRDADRERLRLKQALKLWRVGGVTAGPEAAPQAEELHPAKLCLEIDEAEACVLDSILEAHPLARLELRASLLCDNPVWASEGNQGAADPDLAAERREEATAALLSALPACTSLQELNLGTYNLNVGLGDVC